MGEMSDPKFRETDAPGNTKVPNVRILLGGALAKIINAGKS